jgi:hypothetical protein
MKRFPADLDALMWNVLDAKPEAADELISRHPELAGELARRRVIVQRLKNSRPESRADITAPPPFRPSSAPAQPAIGRSTAIAVGALMLAALGVASFTASYMMTPQPAVVVTPVRTGPPKQEPLVSTGPSHQEPVPSAVTASDSAPSPESQFAENRMESPIAIQITGASLSSVLKAIAVQGRFEIVLAPGMTDDPTISVKYESISPKAILEDLGKRYSFTAYDQGDGSILVVPAVDDSKGPAKPIERTGPPQSRSGS